MALGKKTGGRKKGSTNLPRPGSDYVKDLLTSMGVNSFRNVVRIAQGRIPCTKCRDPKKPTAKSLGEYTMTVARRPRAGDKDDAPATETITLTCEHCRGSKLEPVPIAVRTRIWMDLNQFQAPRLAHVSVATKPPEEANVETLAQMLSRSKALRDAYPDKAPGRIIEGSITHTKAIPDAGTV